MEKQLTKYTDGSYIYKHKCIDCPTGTYNGKKGKTNGRCLKCATLHRIEQGQLAATRAREGRLLKKVQATELAQNILTKESLSEVFDYHIEGFLTWKNTLGPKMQKGNVVGSYNSNGYKQTSFNNRKYYVHRLIYIYHNGEIPEDTYIDHIDRDSTNNRIENLRTVTHTENMQNTLPKGYVYSNVQDRYIVRIRVNNEVKYVGKYKTKEEAQEHYYRAKLKYHI